MDPGTAFLLLSLAVGVGATGYVAVAPDVRTFRATRGARGAVVGGLSAGRTAAPTAFSRPPARAADGRSTLGPDLGWAVRQVVAAGRVVVAAGRGARAAYGPAATAAVRRRVERRARWATRVRALVDRVIAGRRTPDWAVAGATVAAARLGRRLSAVVPSPSPDVVDPDTLPASTPRPSSASDPSQNGATTVSHTVDTVLTVVTEFTSPGQMEEPLEDIKQLADQIVAANAALEEALTDFVNGYADAPFTTAALTAATAALVETIDDEGHVNVWAFVEALPAVAEAIAEAKTLGEAATTIEAEGDVEGFKES